MGADASRTEASRFEARITLARAAGAASAIALAFYLLTLSRSIGFIDKGELLGAASTLGIPHPTGYPTSMVLGFLFTRLLPIRKVLALNLLAALLVAASAGALTVLFEDLFRRVAAPTKTTREGDGSVDAPTRRWMAAAAALGIALTGTWWGQGNGFEVYSLHTLFLPLVILAFFRFVDEGAAVPIVTRRATVFGLLVGLSLTNHLTTVLLAPGLLVYYALATPRGMVRAWLLRLAGVVPGFILGLLPYAWLPLRASMKPWFNWGNPSTLEALVNHVRGKQYSVWFGDWSVFGEQTSFFAGKVPIELGLVGILLVIAGAVLTWRRERKLAVMFLLFIAACIGWSGSYSILEIAPYYLTAMLGLGLFAGMGLVWTFERVGHRLTLAAATVSVALTAACNYGPCDESPNRYVEDMTANVLGALPQGAVIYSSLWDFWVAGSLYLQKVEGLRPDVLVIDPELVRRAWYLDQLAADHPDFTAPLGPELLAFRAQVFKFDHDLPYDPADIDTAYFGLLNAMIERHEATRPAYVTAEVSGRVGEHSFRVPSGLAFKLVKDPKAYVPEEFPHYVFRPWPGHVDYYVAKVHELYGAAVFERARYEKVNGHEALASRYLDYALTFDPHFESGDLPSLPLGSESSVKSASSFFGHLRALKTQ
jgi:hypothetical protein